MVAINSVTPIVNTASAALSSNITLVFDAAVNPSAVNLDTIKVNGSISGKFSGTFSFTNKNKTVVFDPAVDFHVGEEITLTVSTQVQDTSGNFTSLSMQKFRAGVNFLSSWD